MTTTSHDDATSWRDLAYQLTAEQVQRFERRYTTELESVADLRGAAAYESVEEIDRRYIAAARNLVESHAGEQPRMPAIECAPWCADHDGHLNEWCREDQVCWSPAEYIDMSLREVHVEAAGEFPQSIGVMAHQDLEGTVVYLHLRDIQICGGSLLDDSLHLTADEADRLADALRAQAELVRTGGNGSA